MSGPRAFLIHGEVRVRNLARAVRFYRTLGLTRLRQGKMGDGTTIVWLQDPTTHVVVELYYLPKGSNFYRPFPPAAGFAPVLLFSCADGGPLLGRLRARGATGFRSFNEDEVRVTFFRDPEGNQLELLSWTEKGRPAHPRPPLLELALPAGRKRPSRTPSRTSRPAASPGSR